jgi:outer membrane protein
MSRAMPRVMPRLTAPVMMSVLLAAACAWLPLASRADVFSTSSQVTPNPASPLLGGGEMCREGPISTPVTLFEAIERALCRSPKTRSAWAGVKSAAAGVGQAKALYLPTLTGTADFGRQHDVTNVDGPPGLGSNLTENVNTEAVTLAWVLFDFGARSASVRNTHQLLLAAQANQNVVLQATLAATARDYYAAQAAHAKVLSTRRIESGAQQNFEAAGARYKSGVAPITDQLQANTAYAQAVYERAAAEGAARTALGTLAIDMSLQPDERLVMPELDQGALPDASFVHTVRELLDEATENHPAVLAAKATWQAALENVRVVRAQGLPVLSLAGSYSRLHQPLNPNIQSYEYPSTSHDTMIGINLQVPIFSGFSTTYKIREAEAAADQQEQALREAQQEVQLAAWSGFQTLEADTENLKNTNTVLDAARQAFEAAAERYRSGVGNILELLSAQTTLAGAEQQRIQAQLDWRTARLQLAGSLGSLGMWAVK